MAIENPGPGTDLERDMRAIRDAERARLETQPPTDAELRALAAGQLDEPAAERVREWLTLDERWARAYRELDREEDVARLAAEAEREGIDVEAGWRRFEARLETGASAPSPITPSPITPSPITERTTPVLARPLAWAAGLLLALALGHFLLGRLAGPDTPDGPATTEIFLSERATRGGAVALDAGADRVRFVLEVPAASSLESVRVRVRATELLDAAGSPDSRNADTPGPGTPSPGTSSPGTSSPATPSSESDPGRLVAERNLDLGETGGVVAIEIDTDELSEAELFHFQVFEPPDFVTPLWQRRNVLFDFAE